MYRSTPHAASAYPLEWPTGRARTSAQKRETARFDVSSFAVARDELLKELRRMDAKYITLSTNIELRQDGLPYSGRRAPDDPGVAVYFTDRKGNKRAFSCDRWQKIEHNLRAITKTTEALRGIERWGSGDMVEAAFSGFMALPPAPKIRPWWDVLGVTAGDPVHTVDHAYRVLAMRHHPDRGGDPRAMSEVNAAYDSFRKERGLS